MRVLLIEQIAKVAYKYTYSLANSLVANGIDVEVVLDQKQEKENLKCKSTNLFNTDEKNISKINKLANYIMSMRKIVRMTKKEYDIVHIQWIIFSPLDYYYINKIKKNGKKIVITIHDILPFNQKFYDYRYYKKIYDLADAIILQTENNVARFTKIFPVNKTHIYMVPHGHFMDYAEIVDQEESRNKLGFPIEKFVYLFFGQIKKVKGVDILLNAYALLLKKHPDLKGKVQLVIAGNIWKADFKECQRIIDDNKLSEHIFLDIRFIPDDLVDYYYGASDVCVLPYKEVYQSGVLQLTYAHKKVAIVTDIPAFTGIVDETRGFVCKANDSETLSESLYDAYNHRKELNDKAEAGYKYIKEKYDWIAIGKKIANIYSN